MLALQNRTLSPTGLAETTELFPPRVIIEESHDDDDDDESENLGYEIHNEPSGGFTDDNDEDYDPTEDDNFFDAAEEEEFYKNTNSAQDDEEQMRLIVQDLFELEEALLNQHMSNIQEHAEMLTHEGKLLQSVQGANEDEIDEYAIQLAEYLDRKEILIYRLQQKLGDFKSQLAKEQEMAQRVRSLSQY